MSFQLNSYEHIRAVWKPAAPSGKADQYITSLNHLATLEVLCIQLLKIAKHGSCLKVEENSLKSCYSQKEETDCTSSATVSQVKLPFTPTPLPNFVLMQKQKLLEQLFLNSAVWKTNDRSISYKPQR